VIAISPYSTLESLSHAHYNDFRSKPAFAKRSKNLLPYTLAIEPLGLTGARKAYGLCTHCKVALVDSILTAATLATGAKVLRT
jgi:hypothetical protein